jgi:hypothetical protein
MVEDELRPTTLKQKRIQENVLNNRNVEEPVVSRETQEINLVLLRRLLPIIRSIQSQIP